jgi:protein-S-isoprenylcysteine O-methyltransferase Ste14
MIPRIRVPLGFIVAAAVFYFAAPTAISILAGLPIALAGALFRGLAAGVIRKDSRLAKHGPYAWTRNPLYFGSFLLAMGFAVMSASLVATAILLIPFAFIYSHVIKKEEAHLEKLFSGDFRLYRQQVPRFFPRFHPFERSFSFHQYMVNREYNTALGFAAALTIFLVKSRLSL